MCRLSAPSLDDLRDNPAPDQDSSDPLVLGRLSDNDRQAWRIRFAVAAPTRSVRLRDGLDDVHKLRRAMVNASRDPLHGEVEVDETWVGGEHAGLRGSRQLKGRRAALVLLAVEKRGNASGRVRMKVIPDFKAKTIIPFLTQNVSPGSTIYTDGLKSFEGLSEAGFKHIPRIQPLRSDLRKGAKAAVPLADCAIGNLQQWLIGTYHGVSRAQLQVYLDEFVFRHNRRKQPAAAFQTLLGLGTGRKSSEYQRIRGARDLLDKPSPNL